MIPNQSIEVQTSPHERPWVPAWFAEVVIVAQHLATTGLLDALAHQVRLVRARFGRYEPIDFLALLFGYAISGERTFSAFFERVTPFGPAFMALFGRADLPHRASALPFSCQRRPSLFGSVSHALRAEELCPGMDERFHWRYVGSAGMPRHSSLMSMLHAKQRGNEHCPVIQRCLPLATDLMRNVAPGYTGRKRGEVVRTRTLALQMPTRQWIGTSAGRGNGDYQGELAWALQAIKTYLRLFALTPEVALVRLDGQYGERVASAQLIEAGVYLVTRARGYQVLEHPQIQRVLAHPPRW
jgi:hypothetical protein